MIFVAERDKKEDYIQKWQISENSSRPGTGKGPIQESKEELVNDEQDEQDITTPIEQQTELQHEQQTELQHEQQSEQQTEEHNQQQSDEENETLRLNKQKTSVFKSLSKGPNSRNRIGPKAR